MTITHTAISTPEAVVVLPANEQTTLENYRKRVAAATDTYVLEHVLFPGLLLVSDECMSEAFRLHRVRRAELTKSLGDE